jgi:nucleoside-triphosphatase
LPLILLLPFRKHKLIFSGNTYYYTKAPMPPSRNLLLTGNPGIGKTTLMVSLAKALADYHPAGFVTREIREEGVRKGFLLVSCSGASQVLSHVDINSPLRVGKYKIDLPGFEQFLKEIHLAEDRTGLVMIDEIGKMECFSPLFRDSVLRILDFDRPFIATIGKKVTPFMEGIKKRSDVKLVEVTFENREWIRDDLLAEATAMMK